MSPPAAVQSLPDWPAVAPTTRPARRRHSLGAAVAAILCIGGLSIFADRQNLSGDIIAVAPGPERGIAEISASPWQDVSARPGSLDMEPGPVRGAAVQRRSRHHIASGLREDVFSSGAFEDGRAHFVIAIERGPAQSAARPGLFIDIARRAAPLGLAVLRMGQPQITMTKFGEAETAIVTLAGTVERACIALRREDPEGGLRFAGWHCPADSRQSPQALTCLLDRLTLNESAELRIRSLFDRAEARRSTGCAAPAPLVASRARAG